MKPSVNFLRETRFRANRCQTRNSDPSIRTCIDVWWTGTGPTTSGAQQQASSGVNTESVEDSEGCTCEEGGGFIPLLGVLELTVLALVQQHSVVPN